MAQGSERQCFAEIVGKEAGSGKQFVAEIVAQEGLGDSFSQKL